MQRTLLMKHWKVLLIFLISLPSLVFACASFDYGTYYIERGFNILHKDLAGNEFRRVTNSQYIAFYNEKNDQQVEATKQVNLKEWAKYLDKPVEAVEKIIYDGETDRSLSADMQDYLAFMRQAEPLVDYDHIWGMDENTDLKAPSYKAIDTTKASLDKQAIPKFLRLRYLFGAMRLAHYIEDFDKEAALYEQYYPELADVDSEVQFWIAALKAGMDKKQGKAALAAYEFAQIFKSSKTKRYSAYVDFSITSDKDWQKLMSYCKSDDEKALMYFIRALKPKANSLQELKQIYAIAPNSVWVDALLLRELEYVQFAKQTKENQPRAWYNYTLDYSSKILISDIDQYSTAEQQKLTDQKVQRRIEYINNLKQIVQQIRTEGKHKDLFLSDYAEIYLRLLSGEKTTMHDVGMLQTKYQEDPRYPYIEPLKLFVYLDHIPTVNAKIESEISIYLKRISHMQGGGLNFLDILAYTFIKLEPLYKDKKSAFKHYIAKYRGSFNPDNISIAELEDMRRLINKKDKNFLEQQMLNYGEDEYDDTSIPDDPREIIAKRYLAKHQYQKANNILSQIKAGTKIETEYDPFANSLAGNNRNKYDKITTRELAKKLAELSNKLASNPEDAEAHYQLATAAYNLTWFGNSPMVLRYYRSTVSWKYGIIDLSYAKQHYQQAIQYSNDNELKAKALYALAKIEFNEKYMEEGENNAESWFDEYDFLGEALKTSVDKLKKRKFGHYFKKLQQYKNTDYYNDIIAQCTIYRIGEKW